LSHMYTQMSSNIFKNIDVLTMAQQVFMSACCLSD